VHTTRVPRAARSPWAALVRYGTVTMAQAWFTTINLGGSLALAFIGSLAGSYLASYRATRRAEHDERQGR
jgi:hypothetical protein